jgi:hypothetical protein
MCQLCYESRRDRSICLALPFGSFLQLPSSIFKQTMTIVYWVTGIEYLVLWNSNPREVGFKERVRLEPGQVSCFCSESRQLPGRGGGGAGLHP